MRATLVEALRAESLSYSTPIYWKEESSAAVVGGSLFASTTRVQDVACNLAVAGVFDRFVLPVGAEQARDLKVLIECS